MTLAPATIHDFVILGATGDLTRRKLLPALYKLFLAGTLPSGFSVIGFARTKLDTESFRKLAHDALKEFADVPLEDDSWREFSEHVSFIWAGPNGYTDLTLCCEADARIFYLSMPPDAVPEVVRGIKNAGLHQTARVVVEKPFGVDTASALDLNRVLHEVFNEDQIYRIDHYLGKETVQNLLVFRFANSVFERVWNRDAVEHMQLTVAEDIGIEGRGNFYDGVGALRDIVQNHLLQMLAMLTMEAPASFSAERIRDERMKLMRTIRPMDPKRVVRGQYTGGTSNGRTLPSYREEKNVPPNSDTETFFAAEVYIDNWRWAGVPIYLRTGKYLPTRATELEMAFKGTPISYVPDDDTRYSHPNHLIYRIQPDESIAFHFLAKIPGPSVNVKQSDMTFDYKNGFMVKPAEAYERLLHDVMVGDQTLFVRADAIERSWEVVQPVLDSPPPISFYTAGSWGPSAADALITPNQWHLR